MTDTPSTAEQRDYRDTVFLPKTDFPMKAGLPQKEPLILAKWLEGNLEGQIRESRKGRDQFILHDGPPMPMATCTSAMRSTISSRTWSSARRR